MKVTATNLPEVLILEPEVFGDERGWFMETFNERTFHEALRDKGWPVPARFVQDNHSCSKKGVLRGLHYQLPPVAQGKLVRVVQGAAFDVSVDVRRTSPTYGRWVGVELSAVNRRQVWIPEGFAHGFFALADDTQFIYKTTDFYAKQLERVIRWDDPTVGIEWPTDSVPALAAKDAAAPALNDADVFS